MKRTERGFSLLGVVIAMVILAIVGLSMASILSRQRLDHALFAVRTEATAIALGELEWLQASPWPNAQLSSRTFTLPVGRTDWQIQRDILLTVQPAQLRVRVSRPSDRMVLAEVTTFRIPTKAR